MSNVDLLDLFGSVAGALQNSQAELNQADTFNGDHGDNMVEIFETITQALQDKKGAAPAAQLAHASQVLGDKKSKSAQMYALGLSQASDQFEGQEVNQQNAMQLIQTVLGGGESAPSANPLEGLLGGLMGGGQQKGDDSLDAGDLLNAGLAFLSAKKSGESNVEALINAVVSASPLSQTPHRQQSSQVVVNSLLDALSGMQK